MSLLAKPDSHLPCQAPWGVILPLPFQQFAFQVLLTIYGIFIFSMIQFLSLAFIACNHTWAVLFSPGASALWISAVCRSLGANCKMKCPAGIFFSLCFMHFLVWIAACESWNRKSWGRLWFSIAGIKKIYLEACSASGGLCESIADWNKIRMHFGWEMLVHGLVNVWECVKFPRLFLENGAMCEYYLCHTLERNSCIVAIFHPSLIQEMECTWSHRGWFTEFWSHFLTSFILWLPCHADFGSSSWDSNSLPKPSLLLFICYELWDFCFQFLFCFSTISSSTFRLRCVN